MGRFEAIAKNLSQPTNKTSEIDPSLKLCEHFPPGIQGITA